MSSQFKSNQSSDQYKEATAFGDFSLIAERPYKSSWAVSLGAPLKCLRLPHKAASVVLNRHITNENLSILNDTFLTLKPSVKFIRKLCSYFTEREFLAGTILSLEYQD